MLTLPIKKKWFDMIKSGEKKEEYREIKPYYASRFYNNYIASGVGLEWILNNNPIVYQDIILRNGYSNIVFEKDRNKWRVIIRFNKKNYRKRFTNIEDAILHRNKMYAFLGKGDDALSEPIITQ